MTTHSVPPARRRKRLPGEPEYAQCYDCYAERPTVFFLYCNNSAEPDLERDFELQPEPSASSPQRPAISPALTEAVALSPLSVSTPSAPKPPRVQGRLRSAKHGLPLLQRKPPSARREALPSQPEGHLGSAQSNSPSSPELLSPPAPAHSEPRATQRNPPPLWLGPYRFSRGATPPLRLRPTPQHQNCPGDAAPKKRSYFSIRTKKVTAWIRKRFKTRKKEGVEPQPQPQSQPTTNLVLAAAPPPPDPPRARLTWSPPAPPRAPLNLTTRTTFRAPLRTETRALTNRSMPTSTESEPPTRNGNWLPKDIPLPQPPRCPTEPYRYRCVPPNEGPCPSQVRLPRAPSSPPRPTTTTTTTMAEQQHPQTNPRRTTPSTTPTQNLLPANAPSSTFQRDPRGDLIFTGTEGRHLNDAGEATITSYIQAATHGPVAEGESAMREGRKRGEHFEHYPWWWDREAREWKRLPDEREGARGLS